MISLANLVKLSFVAFAIWGTKTKTNIKKNEH